MTIDTHYQEEQLDDPAYVACSLSEIAGVDDALPDAEAQMSQRRFSHARWSALQVSLNDVEELSTTAQSNFRAQLQMIDGPSKARGFDCHSSNEAYRSLIRGLADASGSPVRAVASPGSGLDPFDPSAPTNGEHLQTPQQLDEPQPLDVPTLSISLGAGWESYAGDENDAGLAASWLACQCRLALTSGSEVPWPVLLGVGQSQALAERVQKHLWSGNIADLSEPPPVAALVVPAAAAGDKSASEIDADLVPGLQQPAAADQTGSTSVVTADAVAGAGAATAAGQPTIGIKKVKRQRKSVAFTADTVGGEDPHHAGFVATKAVGHGADADVDGWLGAGGLDTLATAATTTSKSNCTLFNQAPGPSLIRTGSLTAQEIVAWVQTLSSGALFNLHASSISSLLRGQMLQQPSVGAACNGSAAAAGGGQGASRGPENTAGGALLHVSIPTLGDILLSAAGVGMMTATSRVVRAGSTTSATGINVCVPTTATAAESEHEPLVLDVPTVRTADAERIGPVVTLVPAAAAASTGKRKRSAPAALPSSASSAGHFTFAVTAHSLFPRLDDIIFTGGSSGYVRMPSMPLSSHSPRGGSPVTISADIDIGLGSSLRRANKQAKSQYTGVAPSELLAAGKSQLQLIHDPYADTRSYHSSVPSNVPSHRMVTTMLPVKLPIAAIGFKMTTGTLSMTSQFENMLQRPLVSMLQQRDISSHAFVEYCGSAGLEATWHSPTSDIRSAVQESNAYLLPIRSLDFQPRMSRFEATRHDDEAASGAGRGSVEGDEGRASRKQRLASDLPRLLCMIDSVGCAGQSEAMRLEYDEAVGIGIDDAVNGAPQLQQDGHHRSCDDAQLQRLRGLEQQTDKAGSNSKAAADVVAAVLGQCAEPVPADKIGSDDGDAVTSGAVSSADTDTYPNPAPAAPMDIDADSASADVVAAPPDRAVASASSSAPSPTSVRPAAGAPRKPAVTHVHALTTAAVLARDAIQLLLVNNVLPSPPDSLNLNFDFDAAAAAAGSVESGPNSDAARSQLEAAATAILSAYPFALLKERVEQLKALTVPARKELAQCMKSGVPASDQALAVLEAQAAAAALHTLAWLPQKSAAVRPASPSSAPATAVSSESPSHEIAASSSASPRKPKSERTMYVRRILAMPAYTRALGEQWTSRLMRVRSMLQDADATELERQLKQQQEQSTAHNLAAGVPSSSTDIRPPAAADDTVMDTDKHAPSTAAATPGVKVAADAAPAAAQSSACQQTTNASPSTSTSSASEHGDRATPAPAAGSTALLADSSVHQLHSRQSAHLHDAHAAVAPGFATPAPAPAASSTIAALQASQTAHSTSMDVLAAASPGFAHDQAATTAASTSNGAAAPPANVPVPQQQPTGAPSTFTLAPKSVHEVLETLKSQQMRIVIGESALQDGALTAALQDERIGNVKLVERTLPNPISLVVDEGTAVCVLKLKNLMTSTPGVRQTSAGPNRSATASAATATSSGGDEQYKSFVRGLSSHAPRFAHIHVIVDVTGCTAPTVVPPASSADKATVGLSVGQKPGQSRNDALAARLREIMADTEEDDDGDDHARASGAVGAPMRPSPAALKILQTTLLATINFSVPVQWHTVAGSEQAAKVVRMLMNVRAKLAVTAMLRQQGVDCDLGTSAGSSSKGTVQASSMTASTAPSLTLSEQSITAAVEAVQSFFDRSFLQDEESAQESFLSSFSCLNPFSSMRILGTFVNLRIFLPSPLEHKISMLAQWIHPNILQHLHEVANGNHAPQAAVVSAGDADVLMMHDAARQQNAMHAGGNVHPQAAGGASAFGYEDGRLGLGSTKHQQHAYRPHDHQMQHQQQKQQLEAAEQTLLSVEPPLSSGYDGDYSSNAQQHSHIAMLSDGYGAGPPGYQPAFEMMQLQGGGFDGGDGGQFLHHQQHQQQILNMHGPLAGSYQPASSGGPQSNYSNYGQTHQLQHHVMLPAGGPSLYGLPGHQPHGMPGGDLWKVARQQQFLHWQQQQAQQLPMMQMQQQQYEAQQQQMQWMHQQQQQQLAHQSGGDREWHGDIGGSMASHAYAGPMQPHW